MNESDQPKNIVKFKPDLQPDTILIDQQTWRRIKMLARRFGTTTDAIIEEALRDDIERHKIGESLITHLQHELDVCGADRKRRALRVWQERIEDLLQSHGGARKRAGL